jgi:hypothetical protein
MSKTLLIVANTDGLVPRDTCVSSIQLNRAVLRKIMLLALENDDM